MKAAPHVSAPLASAGYRRGLESVASLEDLRAAILRRTLLPGRRFRVEGCRLSGSTDADATSNSALVFEPEAVRLAAKYGGQIVQVVSAEQFYANHEACQVHCRRCGSTAGTACHSRRGKTRIPVRVHLVRVQALSQRTACPRCHAMPLNPCLATRGPAAGLGHLKKEHKERVAADDAAHKEEVP